ncbi:MAG: Ig-like domain-containing protein [Verrucomicrobiota bacterium JB023]|nr:Ig-like domain-containing protein [Verrucomicrobiota bacterium JB023]
MKLATLAFSLPLLIPGLQAAEITWGEARDIVSRDDVNQTGTLIEAYNLGGTAAANVTILGTTFLAKTDLLPQSTNIDSFTGSTGDDGYDQLLSQIDYGGGTNTVTLSVGNRLLTPGTTYDIQVWFVDSRFTNRETPVGDGQGNQVTLSSTGQHARGTFTADGSTQTLTLESPSFGNAHLNAYQIRETSSRPMPTLSADAPTASGPFPVELSFSEAVSGLEEADFQVTNGQVSPGSLSGNETYYTLSIIPLANGEVTLFLPAASVIDTDGDTNENLASNLLNVFHLAPGADQPEVSLTTDASTVNQPFDVTVSFTEAVTGLEVTDFASSNASLSSLAGSGSTYTLLVTPLSDGEVVLSLPAGRVTDTDGDEVINSASNELIVAYSEPDIPSVTIYSQLETTVPDYTIYLTFSEEVSGLTDDDFAVVNGTVSGTSGSGRYWSALVTASAQGAVEVSLPADSVTDLDADGAGNSASNTFTTQCLADFGERWLIDDEEDWAAASAVVSSLKLEDGYAEPTGASSQFTSTLFTLSGKRKAKSLTFTQSPAWDNWTAIPDVQPDGANDAPVLVPVGPDNYYLLARDHSNNYYAAWHSEDMENWTYRGPVTPATTGRWVTTAEYVDGNFYIYSDYFNDHTPRLFVDDDLDDGVPGIDYGFVFIKEASGSDNSLIRNDEDGLWHMIYEDWSPINARTHSWDSPLAGHTSSPDGINGFTENKHQPAVDHRTTPTGTFGTYDHPNVPNETYEIHTPAQDAFGDWTSVKIGSRFFLFGDYDPHGEGIKLARFASDSIYEEFEFTGEMHAGHPDPTVGFAEGQFYLITQQDTDYVSPGPWVEGVEARAGVDTDGDGTIDEWTSWETISEQYDYTPNYIRVVTLTPAGLDLSNLSAGYGFQFEFRIDDTVVPGVSPIMDSVEMTFQPSNFQVWANEQGIAADADQDRNENGRPDIIDFTFGDDAFQPVRQPDGSLTLTARSEAIEDGVTIDLYFSDDLQEWFVADEETEGVKFLGSQANEQGDYELSFEIFDRNGKSIFWHFLITMP